MSEGKGLEDLRRDVDLLDDALHDILMRRASVTDAIARLKPRTGDRIPLARAMRPAREAEIMRRIVARHKGALPLATAVRVIREVLAASLAAQVPFRLHVFGGAPECANLAREYFGVGTPIMVYESPSRVMHACGDDPDSIGIVPLPDAAGENWWSRLASKTGPRVIARVPFLQVDARHDAWAIAAIDQEPTGDDTSVLIAELAPSLSRSRLLTQLKDAGITARVIAGSPGDVEAPVLLEAEGFVAADDPRLAAFCSSPEFPAGSIYTVGGYANPIPVQTKEPQ